MAEQNDSVEKEHLTRIVYVALCDETCFAHAQAVAPKQSSSIVQVYVKVAVNINASAARIVAGYRKVSPLP